MVIDDMQCLQAMVVATSLSMNDRFTLLAEMSPLQRAAPLRTRRMSTNEGPIFSTNLRAMPRRFIDDEWDQQLGLDRSVEELLEDNRSRAGSMSRSRDGSMPRSRAGSMPRSRAGSMPRSRDGSMPRSRAGSMPRSRAGSMPRSRAGSMSRYSGKDEMPGLVQSNGWGRLSPANSVGNLSHRSGQSGRSSGGQSHHSRAMSFKGPDLHQRLQMRDAWIRKRNMRARGRGRGGRRGNMQWNQQRGHWNNPQRRWGPQNQRQQWWHHQGRQQWLRQQHARQQWFHQQRFHQQQGRQQWIHPHQGGIRSWSWPMPPLTPRGRAGQENPGYVHKRGGVGRGRGRGRGRGGGGRGGQNTVAEVETDTAVFNPPSQNSMPALKSKDQLDKELDEYMASAPASLDKELDQYMAQSGLSMDSE